MSADLFSKVVRRMWLDEKFCKLSRPEPNARDLWIYLLTGPHNTSIPGIFVKGELGLAEELEWDIDATRSCLKEILDQGMVRFDRKRRLVWLPNALQHNMPQTWKNVAGWTTAWRLLPECDLLLEAAAEIRSQLAARSPRLADAFDRVVAGQAPPVDAEDDAAGTASGRAASVGKMTGTVMGSEIPSETGTEIPSPMPSHEREREMERDQDPPLGGEQGGSPAEMPDNASGRCPGPVSPPDPPRADVGPSQPQHEPPATSDAQARRELSGDALAVYELLMWQPSHWDAMSPQPLKRLATVETARRLAAKAGPEGRLELADVLGAIRQCAGKEVARRDAHEPPAPRERLASMLEGFVDRMRRGEMGGRADATSTASAGMRDRGARVAELAAAYADGQTKASGAPFPALAFSPQAEAALTAYAVDKTGARLTGEALTSWVRESSADYRRARADGANFEHGFSPSKWAEWLQAGRPSAKTGARPNLKQPGNGMPANVVHATQEDHDAIGDII